MASDKNLLLSVCETDAEFKMVNKLFTFLDGKELNFESVTEFLVRNNFVGPHRQEINTLKRILKYAGFEYPSEYGTLMQPISVSRTQFLRDLRNICATHSVYAYVATRLVVNKNPLTWTYLDVKTQLQESIYPKWIQLIWDRQHRLMKNAQLSDDELFFFCYTHKGEMLANCKEQYSVIIKKFSSAYKYEISDYIKQYKQFRGMSDDGLMVINFKPNLENVISKRRERNFNRIVRVTDLQQNTMLYGVCLGEAETGIYMVIGEDDNLYKVPFYRLDMPSSGEQFEWPQRKDYYRHEGKFMGKWTDIKFYLEKEKYVRTHTHNS